VNAPENTGSNPTLIEAGVRLDDAGCCGAGQLDHYARVSAEHILEDLLGSSSIGCVPSDVVGEWRGDKGRPVPQPGSSVGRNAGGVGSQSPGP